MRVMIFILVVRVKHAGEKGEEEEKNKARWTLGESVDSKYMNAVTCLVICFKASKNTIPATIQRMTLNAFEQAKLAILPLCAYDLNR